MPAEKMRDAREGAVGGVAVSQKGNARMDGKCATKTGIGKTKDLQKIQKDYEETVQALKRIDEIWETLTDNEKKMMRTIKRMLRQKKARLERKIKEVC